MKKVLGAAVVAGALSPALAMAELTVPTIGTTDVYAGGTAVLAGLAVITGICWVISLFRKGR